VTVVKKVKASVVRVLGRERANQISAPFYDWVVRRLTERFLSTLPKFDLCVNIGCGYRPLSGWINLDRARGPDVQVTWDIRRGLPFHSGTCSAIFGEHLIEHLSKVDGDRFLKECHRVLQQGGVLRLSTPDTARYLKSYANGGEFLRHPSFPQAIDTPLDRINLMMREEGQHLWVYDAASLSLALKRAGFSSAVEQAFGISLHPRMCDIDSEARAFESLYMDAVK
jgi:predicted SAM-dependent methyltransferase